MNNVHNLSEGHSVFNHIDFGFITILMDWEIVVAPGSVVNPAVVAGFMLRSGTRFLLL